MIPASHLLTNLHRSWLTESELWTCLELAKYAEYTTVRGPLRMAPLFDHHLAVIPAIQRYLQGEKPYGAFIIRYAVGGEKGPHLDAVPSGKTTHDRMVCLLQAPGAGGELRFEGELVPLAVRDAVQFRADLISHAIGPVLEGERIVLTVGRCAGKEVGP